MEERIAELGAVFLCADLGITDEMRADHAQYLDFWPTNMRADKAIFTAASKASEAVAFLAALQRTYERRSLARPDEAPSRRRGAVIVAARTTKENHHAQTQQSSEV